MTRIAARCGAAALGLGLALGAASARAQEPAEAPRDAYARGAKALERGEYGAAAVAFARADELKPNPVALKQALEAATLAEDAPLAMELADRAAREPPGGPVAKAARSARDKLGDRAGAVTVECGAAPSCAAKLDGAPMPVHQKRWAKTGAHVVEFDLGAGDVRRVEIEVLGRSTLEVRPPEKPRGPVVLPTPAAPAPAPASPGASAPAPAPAAPAVAAPPSPPAAAPTTRDPASARGADVVPARSGLHPAWFFVGLGATAIAGGVTVWSGVDTLDKHAQFDGGDTAVRDAGLAAQTRTNVLLGVTGALGLGTLALAIFGVDWAAAPERAAAAGLAVSPAAGPGGASLSVGRRF